MGEVRPNRVLVYDSDCPMCTAIVNGLVRRRLLDRGSIVSFDKLRGDERERVWNAGIQNEIVALDRDKKETKVGAKGLLWATTGFGERSAPILVWILKLITLPVISQIASGVYRVISYNRRFVAPTRGPIVCNCDPEFSWSYRLIYLVLCSLLTVFSQIWFASEIKRIADLGPSITPYEVGMGLTVGALLLFAASMMLGVRRGIDYLTHVLTAIAFGSILLLPFSAVAALVPESHPSWAPATALLLIGHLATIIIIFRSQFTRIRGMELSKVWGVVWFAALVLGMLCADLYIAPPAASADNSQEITLISVPLGHLPPQVKLLGGEVVSTGPHDTVLSDAVDVDAETVLRIERQQQSHPIGVAPAQDAIFPLLEITDPAISLPVYVLTGQIRYTGFDRPGYLELQNHFPDGSVAFTRTRSDSGPTGMLDGSSDWREFRLPFFLGIDDKRVGAPGAGILLAPTKLELQIHIPSKGLALLKDIKLVQYAAGYAMPAREAVNWWTERTAALVWGIVGTSVGLLGAVVGGLAGFGWGGRFVYFCLRAFLVVGVLMLCLGGSGYLLNQPYHVYYPPLLLGAILTMLGISSFGLTKTRYGEQEDSGIP